MNKEAYSSYRWAILMVSWVCMFILSFGWYVMPSLSFLLPEIYEISVPQYNLAITFPFLIAGILCIPGGMLADTLGIRKTVTISMIFGALGFIGRAYLTGGFPVLLLSMSGVGIAMGLMFPNIPKMVSAWFPPKQAGFASGIFTTGMFVGIASGMATALYLPEWGITTIILGILVFISSGAFFLIVRDAPPGEELPSPNLLDGLKAGIRSRTIWAAALASFAGFGGMVCFINTYPTAVTSVYELTPEMGSLLGSLITYLGIPGSLILPLLTEKIQRRSLLIIIGLTTGFGIIIPWLLASTGTFWLWIGVIVAGLGGGGLPPLILEIPVLLPSIEGNPIGKEHVGGASALITSLMQFGGFFCLPFIVEPIIISSGYTLGYTVSAILFGSLAGFALMFNYPKDM
ncbi:MAG: MFS transporter [Promethearchaeia archaeon]